MHLPGTGTIFDRHLASKMSEQDDDERQRQEEAFDKTTAKGKESGLFRACMKAIRSSHGTANRLRLGIVVAGLFTDVSVYSEVIALFYLATQAMEERCEQLLKEKDDPIARSLLSLGYHFTPAYQVDLKLLYESKLGFPSWKHQVQEVMLHRNDSVRSYVQHIHNMQSGAELAGAAFCLWGALWLGLRCSICCFFLM